VAVSALGRTADTPGPIVLLSTAHASKFPEDVAKVTGLTPQLPRGTTDLADRPERFDRLAAEPEIIKAYVRTFAEA
jgi:threonine synthase